MSRLSRGAGVACALLAALAVPSVHAQSVAVTGGVPAAENFDSLAATGTASTLPNGWYISESDDNADGTYAADDGSIMSGNTYSYGTTGSSERALGALQSGSLVPMLGAQLQNQSGSTLSEIAVAYTGEQWRLGTVGRVDRLDFQYSLDATSLTTGTWVHVDALDFTAPVSSGATGKLDGNALANRSAVAGTIGGLSWAQGATLWVRWTDLNASSNDDGLAIDDISFGVPGDFPPQVISSNPTQGTSDVAVASTLQLTFSEAIAIANAAGITLDCGAGTPTFQTAVNTSVLSVTPDADLPFGAACSLALTANSVTDLDGTADPMDAPFALLFDTVVDNAPTLVSSTPANGALDFPANANLQLVFSEPVTLGADWFAIACDVSGARGPADVVLGGGPSSFSLNPDVDFSEGENCTLTLDPSAIEDLDGAADALVDPGSIAFVPAAPVVNQPPTVLSTTPMAGSSDFPSAADIVVLFSEAVTVAPGAFTLACDASTGISLLHAASGTSFSIDTGTALVGGDSCTLTIVAALVQDVEGANPDADVVVAFTVSAGGPGSYYDQVNTSSPDQLRCSLHETINGHTEYPYGWTQLEIADEAPADVCAAGAASSENYILDVYRNRCYEKVTDRSNPVDPFHYNREHVWPRSLGFNDTGLAAHNDLHMLHLSASDWNGQRGNKPFANCDSGCTALGTDANNGVGGTADPGDSNWVLAPDGNAGSFEVWDHMKGNMARAIFYMAIRYEGGDNLPDLELTDNRSLIVITPSSAQSAYMGLLSDLLQWHQLDPPDARELDRNEVVYGFQGNRNPFVDHPEWATQALFTSSQPVTCELNTGGNTAPVAVDDSYAGDQDAALIVSQLLGVLANDTDADSDPLSATLVGDVQHGTLALAADGSFTYTPAPGYCGTDGFSYQAGDGQATSATASVALTVACASDAIFDDGFED